MRERSVTEHEAARFRQRYTLLTSANTCHHPLFHAWLLRLCLERACALLSRSSQAIATVAQKVGFYDQSHFNRAFRQAYGIAPSNYRA
ncbi:helix-turn-helix transcriptional regulator [Paraburkholderia sediminicola]|uniref:helix-turn-helix transcriptional regulator n=1 Tax=Paraburkholderia sediminicola TaxID=458836 RepID=UPI0038BC24B4